MCMYYRILEVKHEMFKLEMLEFHYFDDLLTDMKLTPVSCLLVKNKQSIDVSG